MVKPPLTLGNIGSSSLRMKCTGKIGKGIRLGAFAFHQLEKLVHPRSDELVRIQLDASAPDIHIEKYGKIWIDMVRFCGIILDRKLK